jgi:phosphonate transport system permease protein
VSSDTGSVRRTFDDVKLTHDPRELFRARPKSSLVRWSVVALAALVVYAWLSGDIAFDDIFSERRLANLRRFLSVDVKPFALRNRPFDLGEYAAWAWHLVVDRGFSGMLATLSISVLAISLAGVLGATLMLFAARNLAAPEPFARVVRPDAPRRRLWTALTSVVRAFCVFLRAIPEYVWAFLLLAMLGPSAWPAVLALGIHNAGILGKLGAETVENLDPKSLRALRELGATRKQLAAGAVLPLALSRFLLYFFYRFETCVREATVLGMLGVVSLGYWIQDARSKQFYDEMVLFVALGAVIVLAADLVSALLRAIVRKAS